MFYLGSTWQRRVRMRHALNTQGFAKYAGILWTHPEPKLN